ncbi:hypothetical protein [Candidatus Binatus sp.]|uniref:hypothetical protein n=1 Tax=Candidatus Binatus sp. TaxID=2811406 RepID=UPI003C50E891
MKLGKTLAIVACAVLLSVCLTGFGRQAYAQDNSDGADEDSSVGVDPLLALGSGCWFGDIGQNISQNDTSTFNFVVDGKKIQPTSTFVFSFNNGDIMVGGMMKGSVTEDGFKIKGSAGKGCKLKASGKLGGGGSTFINGEYKFTGKCPAGIDKAGNISISEGC